MRRLLLAIAALASLALPQVAQARATQIAPTYSPVFSSTGLKFNRRLLSWIAPTAPTFYAFTAGSGAGTEGWGTGTAISIHGLNGFTTLLDSGSGASNTAVKVNTTTHYTYGTSGSSSAHAAKYAGSPYSYFRTTMVQGTQRFELHRNMVGGTDSFSGLRGGGGTSTYFNLQAFSNGTGGTTSSVTGHLVYNGDVLEWETIGTKIIPRLNGRQISATAASPSFPTTGFDLTALGITPTGNYGWNGLAPTTGASYDAEFGYSGGTDRMTLFQPTHNAQIETDGTLKLTIDATYTGSDPASSSLSYSITTSTGAAVSGQTNQPIQSLSIGGGSITGKTIAFTPSAGTAYVLKVCRNDAAGGKSICSHGPYVYPSENIGIYGQSNAGNSYSSVATLETFTAATNAYNYDAANNVSGSMPLSDFTVAISNTPNSALAGGLAGTIQSNYSAATGVGMIMGGRGSTSIQTRGPNSVDWATFLGAIRNIGKNIRTIYWIDGESNTGDDAAYVTTWLQLADLADAYNGRAINYYMKPVGSHASGATSTNSWEAIRRAQAKLAYDYSNRSGGGSVRLGAFALDMQHQVTGSTYSDLHFSPDTYAIVYRRMARTQAWYDGKSSYNLLGPAAYSVAKVDNTHVNVTFDLNTLTGMRYLNSAYGVGGAEFGGGMRFASSAANLLSYATLDTVASAATIDAPVSGKVTVHFTLSSPIVGPIYVGFPWGENPANPTGNNTVELNLRTNASILGGYIAGEDDVMIQPFWCFGGNGSDASTAAGCTPGNDFLIAS
jgi:hypothetical protein